MRCRKSNRVKLILQQEQCAVVRIRGRIRVFLKGFCCALCNMRRQYVAFSIFQLKTILRDIDGEERLCAGSAAEKPRSKQTLSQLKENPS